MLRRALIALPDLLQAYRVDPEQQSWGTRVVMTLVDVTRQ